jgi:thiosulfate dehydrogenase [quinone] large subunit
MESSLKSSDLVKAYFLLRLTMGFNMLGHGLVRMPKLHGFSAWMTELFQESLLPNFMVVPFSYTVPFVELAVGLFLILGWKTSKALNLGAATMVALVFGSCLIEKWSWASSQMLYGLFFFGLSYFISLNRISLDYYFQNKKS